MGMLIPKSKKYGGHWSLARTLNWCILKNIGYKDQSSQSSALACMVDHMPIKYSFLHNLLCKRVSWKSDYNSIHLLILKLCSVINIYVLFTTLKEQCISFFLTMNQILISWDSSQNIFIIIILYVLYFPIGGKEVNTIIYSLELENLRCKKDGLIRDSVILPSCWNGLYFKSHCYLSNTLSEAPWPYQHI